MATRDEPLSAEPHSPADPRGATPGDGGANVAPIAFETAMRELESIVERMEAGTLGLEESLAAYRRGAALVTQCREGLARVQQQVRVLESDLLKPFDVDADVER